LRFSPDVSGSRIGPGRGEQQWRRSVRFAVRAVIASRGRTAGIGSRKGAPGISAIRPRCLVRPMLRAGNDAAGSAPVRHHPMPAWMQHRKEVSFPQAPVVSGGALPSARIVSILPASYYEDHPCLPPAS
jgi:hypothetical protein